MNTAPNYDATPAATGAGVDEHSIGVDSKHGKQAVHGTHVGVAFPIVSKPTLTLTPASEIKNIPPNWLWEDFVVGDGVTLFTGEPGSGKSTLSIAMAASLSMGRPLFASDQQCEPADVLIVACEDSGETIRRRLEANGADLSKVIIGEGNGVDLSRPDVFAGAFTKHPNLRMIIVDPVTAFMGNKRQNDNGDVRKVMSNLASLAHDKRVAIVLITHNGKHTERSAGARVLGSTAFLAATRIAWLVHPFEHGVGVACLKNNYGPRPPSMGFVIDDHPTLDAGVLKWCSGTADVTADELLALTVNRKSNPRHAEIDAWLRHHLSTGPQPQPSVVSAGEAKGYKVKDLRLSLKRIGGKSTKGGFANCPQLWERPIHPMHSMRDMHSTTPPPPPPMQPKCAPASELPEGEPQEDYATGERLGMAEELGMDTSPGSEAHRIADSERKAAG